MTQDGTTPEHILHTVFGFREFRGLQAPAIHHVVNGGDALVLMPTGGGKSVCYQVPALCRHGLGLVVSPLIALMDDQVAALRQLGVSAVRCIPSSSRTRTCAFPICYRRANWTCCTSRRNGCCRPARWSG